MPRRFTFYRKKRGDRVSGSTTLATMGEAILFAACAAVGAVALAVILSRVIVPQWGINRHFLETTCQVIAAPEVVTRDSADGTEYRPKIPVQYTVDGTTYTSDGDSLISWYSEREDAEQFVARFEVGGSYPCWYDPQDPASAVLARGHQLTFWLLLLLPTAFLAIGLGGLGYTVWQWSTSRERRSAIANIAAEMEFSDQQPEPHVRFPSVPADAELKNSPGTTLAYRLPIATRTGWQLFAITCACLFWNGLVVLVFWVAIGKHLAGRGDWLLDVMLIPFVAAGVWLVGRLIRQFLRANAIGATRVEISDHPLEAGGQYEVYISQSGNLDVKALEVMLVCEEQATFRQGTDSVTDAQIVAAKPVLEQQAVQVRPGRPYEARCQFRVPTNVMHSFQADHNAIHWKLVVRGDVEHKSGYERDFPVIVVPKVHAVVDAAPQAPDKETA